MSRMPAARSRGFRTLAGVLLTLLLSAPINATAPASAQTPRLGEASLDDVIDAMTIREKASLLVGMGMNLPFAVPGLPQPSPEDRSVPERVPGAAGRTHAIERLGIPSIVLADGPAGVRIDPVRAGEDRTYHATAFPVATLLSSSWDPALAETVGAAFGRELKEYGADVLLAPGMNLHRNPLGGRNFEYYSEDPVLNGRMAAGFVRGVESEGVGTAPKHFAVNSQEFNRLKSNSIIGQRALRELYLRGYGLSYTTFEYGDLTLSDRRFDGHLAATVTVTNTGPVAGREVVQLYVSAPDGELVKPASELRAFAKTKMLRSGESERITFTLDGRDLASFDADHSAWVVEGGEYEVGAAASSRDRRAVALFSVPETRVIEEVHDVMAPEVETDLLRQP